MSERSTILLIDGDAASQVALHRELDRAGHEVHLAADVDSGLGRALELQPDLALCGAGGADRFCRAARGEARLEGLFITVLGSFDDRAELHAALDAGADDFLIAPVETAILQARVRAGLKMVELGRELGDNRRRELMLEIAVTLGHEINNPLMAMLGHLELIGQYVERGESDKVAHHLDGCRGAVERMTEVARGLVELRDPRSKPYLGDQAMVDLGDDS